MLARCRGRTGRRRSRTSHGRTTCARCTSSGRCDPLADAAPHKLDLCGAAELCQACAAANNGRTRAMSLMGKAALITGSTSGIGLGIARSLAAAGADLMLNGFGDPADIEAQRAILAADHG